MAEFRDRSGSSLPSEVRAILAAAPIPSDVFSAPKAMTESERREGERMSQAVAETNCALAAVPGSVAGVSGL